jgi:cytoskeletal protein CcmA (bactofilin family)
MKIPRATISALAVCLGVAILAGPAPRPGTANAQDAGASVLRTGAGDDAYMAGGRVDFDGEAAGDVLAAGGRVRIQGTVRGDAIVAGGMVSIAGEVADDARAVGADVELAATVGDDLVVAGGAVSLRRGTRVGGQAFLAGGQVEALGRFDRDVRIAAGRAVLGGTVAGDVTAVVGRLTVLPGTRIGGRLTYTSRHEADIAPDAEIAGGVDRSLATPSPRDEGVGHARGLWPVAAAGYLAWFAGLALAGLSLAALFPVAVRRSTDVLRARPWSCIGLGFVVIVVAPAAAVTGMIVIVGIPLALALLAAWAVALLVAYLTAARFLADAGLRLAGHETGAGGWLAGGAFLAALALLGAAGALPVIGGAISAVAVLAGLGAWAMVLAERYRAA